MQTFLVERDLSGISMADLASARFAAIRQSVAMYAAGDRVQLLRSIYLPDEGRCLCLFEAKNAEIVAQLNRDARISFDRVVPAMDFLPASIAASERILAPPTPDAYIPPCAGQPGLWR
jgi:Protein of unknown function (DUF4242)